MERLKFEYLWTRHGGCFTNERFARRSRRSGLLLDAQVRASFMERLTGVVRSAPFLVVASAIRKNEFKERRGTALNPYNVALEYGLERVFFQLQDRGQVGRKDCCHLRKSRVESRTISWELEFRRIMDATKVNGMAQTLEFHIASKQVNSSGLQLADMVARPIALKIIRAEATQPSLGHDRARRWQSRRKGLSRGTD